MMRRVIIMFAIFCFWSCQSKVKEEVQKNIKIKSIVNVQEALDTILHFERLDICEFSTPDYWYDGSGFSLFIEKGNNPNIGVVLGKDSTFVFMKKTDFWQKVPLDSFIQWQLQWAKSVEMYDINGDNFKDIRINNNFGAYMSPTHEYLLYDKQSGNFRYNHFFENVNEYDHKTHLVRYCYTPPHLHGKGTYKIIGDSLAIVDEISHGDIDYFEEIKIPENYYGTVATHYRYKNGKRKLIKVVFDNDTTQNSLDYFINALWKIDW